MVKWRFGVVLKTLQKRKLYAQLLELKQANNLIAKHTLLRSPALLKIKLFLESSDLVVDSAVKNRALSCSLVYAPQQLQRPDDQSDACSIAMKTLPSRASGIHFSVNGKLE